MQRARRSRKQDTSSFQQNEEEKFLLVKINEEIGYGIFCKKEFQKGEFLLQYKGEVIMPKEAEIRSRKYTTNFLFYGVRDASGKNMCVDATNTEGYGRMVNDAPAKSANAIMKRIIVNGKISLCLYASETIPKGTEVRYDYGETTERMPWRQIKENCIPVNLEDITPSVKNDKERCIPISQVEITPTVKTVNDFKLRKINLENNDRIGEGASAVIFKAKINGKDAAIKLFKQPLTGRKIERIARKLLQLNHENLVGFVGFNTKPSMLALEYCELIVENEVVHNVSQLLEIWNDDNHFNFIDRFNLIYQATLGLNALHKMSILHKDFKPTNLLVTKNNEQIVVKVADYDEFYDVKATITFTVTMVSTLAGFTLAYAAEEICMGLQGPSFESDIFAWAMTCYEIFAGVTSPWEKTFPVPNDAVVLDALKQGRRPAVTDFIFKYDGGYINKMSSLIETCWLSDPTKRMNCSQESADSVDFQVTDSNKNVCQSKQLDSNNTNIVSDDVIKELDTNSVLSEQIVSDDVLKELGTNSVLSEQLVSDDVIKELDTNSVLSEQIVSGDAIKELDTNSVLSEQIVSDDVLKELGTNSVLSEQLVSDDVIKELDTNSVLSEQIVSGDAIKELDTNSVLSEQLVSDDVIKELDTNSVLSEQIVSDDILKELGTNSVLSEQNVSDDVMKEFDTISVLSEQFIENVDQERDTDKESLPRQIPTLNDSGFDLDSDIALSDTDSETILVSEENNPVYMNQPPELEAECVEESDIEEMPEMDHLPNVTSYKLMDNLKKETQSSLKKGKQRYRKPERLCIFCNKLLRKLSRHLRLAHKHEPRIKNAMKLNRKERIKVFKDIRREGILKFNKKEARKEIPSFQGERIRKKYFDLKRCSCCNAFISKRFFSRHSRLCKKKNDVPVLIGIPLVKDIPDDVKISDDFIREILYKLRDDDVGSVIRKDSHILYVGNKLYRKLKHKKEKVSAIRNQVRTEMRMLASLYMEFQSSNEINSKYGNSLDLFMRDNFDSLCDSIDILTTKENKTLKSGQRKNLYYMLTRSAKRLRDKLFQEKQDDLSNEVNSFLRLLKSNEDFLLSNALYNLEKAKLKKNRKPSQLPLEEDIKAIYLYIQKKFKELCSNLQFWTQSSFVELRNATMTRLTLLNGRRGGEVGRFIIEDWEEAKLDGWINTQRMKVLSESEQMLVKSLKLAYQAGKGNRHLVSLLIPKDTVPAIEILVNKEIREKSGVRRENNFVFASTQQSELNFSGWHSLKEICKNAKLIKPELMTATNNRHRVSTLYASLDITEKERDLFYTHMGHSKEMNENTYQSPLGLMTAVKVGNRLLQLQGEPSQTQTSEVRTRQKDADDGSIDKVSGGDFSCEKGKKRILRVCEVYASEEDAEDDSQNEVKGPMSTRKVYSKRRRTQNKGENSDDDSVNDENVDDSEIVGKETNHVRWTPTKEVVFKRFQGFVDRTETKPFPSRSEIEKMCKELGRGFGVSKIRTKINNERMKVDQQRKERERNLNI